MHPGLLHQTKLAFHLGFAQNVAIASIVTFRIIINKQVHMNRDHGVKPVTMCSVVSNLSHNMAVNSIEVLSEIIDWLKTKDLNQLYLP